MQQVQLAVTYRLTPAELRRRAVQQIARRSGSRLWSSFIGAYVGTVIYHVVFHHRSPYSAFLLMAFIFGVWTLASALAEMRYASRGSAADYGVEVYDDGVMFIAPNMKEFVGWPSIRVVAPVQTGVMVKRTDGSSEIVPLRAFGDGNEAGRFTHAALALQSGSTLAEPGVWPPPPMR